VKGVAMGEMKYRIAIDQHLGFVVISFREKVYANDMFDMLEELYAREDFDPAYPAIYDFTGSAAIAYRVDVVSFVERIRKLRSGISEKKKIGIVVNSINQKFLVNMFIKLINVVSLKVEMFDKTNSCLSWMSDDPVVQKSLSELLILNKQELLKS
jgi:hypothetical protein